MLSHLGRWLIHYSWGEWKVFPPQSSHPGYRFSHYYNTWRVERFDGHWNHSDLWSEERWVLMGFAPTWSACLKMIEYREKNLADYHPEKMYHVEACS